MGSRRNFIKQSGVLGLAGIAKPFEKYASVITPKTIMSNKEKRQWADGSRLIVSISMQFEAGGQPVNAESPFPNNLIPGYIDLPAYTWYEYGYKEGIPRMLDNWDKHNIKITSHMVGAAVQKNPQLAKEIVDRGHEAAAHGLTWDSQYALPYDEEKKFIKDGADIIERITGKKPVGYNANWLRRGENTLKILQELGFVYHIDDLSYDEPFITKVNNKDFVTVPYTLRNNDILLIEGKSFSADQFINQIKLEFDQLYAEAEYKRRLLSISFHDRIGGTPQMVAAATQLINYMKKQKGVVFKRKDEIAQIALSDSTTLKE